jgi:hypothetical protein
MQGDSKEIGITKLSEQGEETDLDSTTPAERLARMWQLGLNARAFKGEPIVESRLPRHIVSVQRRRG